MSETFHKRKRRGRWIVSGILVVLVLVSISSLLFINYTNRSTPDKTLDAFCSSLLHANYRSAYEQFSAQLQRNISEEVFAASFTQDAITTCTHDTTDDFGNRVTSVLKLVHVSHGRNNNMITLVKDSNNNWKIDDIFRLAVT